MTTDIRVIGSFVQVMMICPRQVWLMSRQICPDEDNVYLELGRLTKVLTEIYKTHLDWTRVGDCDPTIRLTEIYKTHLDPRIGYLHATNFRRFTLNLDVAEIFKPIFADRVLFTLVGKKMIGPGDFERHGAAVLLKESGRRRYVKELEEKLKTTFYHRRLKRNVSYQTLLRLELYKLEKHLIGEETYEPFVSRW